MSLIAGRKYKSRVTGIIWQVLFAGEQMVVLRVVDNPLSWAEQIFSPGTERFYTRAECESNLRAYTPPVKPFRIRTVAVVNPLTGAHRVASITDSYPTHRVDDPSWPTGWPSINEVRVYDQIVSVNPEEK